MAVTYPVPYGLGLIFDNQRTSAQGNQPTAVTINIDKSISVSEMLACSDRAQHVWFVVDHTIMQLSSTISLQ